MRFHGLILVHNIPPSRKSTQPNHWIKDRPRHTFRLRRMGRWGSLLTGESPSPPESFRIRAVQIRALLLSCQHAAPIRIADQKAPPDGPGRHVTAEMRYATFGWIDSSSAAIVESPFGVPFMQRRRQVELRGSNE